VSQELEFGLKKVSFLFVDVQFSHLQSSENSSNVMDVVLNHVRPNNDVIEINMADFPY